MKFVTLFFIFTTCLSTFTFWSQENNTERSLQNKISIETTPENFHNTDSLKNTLTKGGYYFFTTDTSKDSTNKRHFIKKGPKISIVKISNLSKNIKKLLKIKDGAVYILPKNIKKWFHKLNHDFDHQGMSFTNSSLINQTLINDTLYCDLEVHQTHKRYIDKIITKGYSKFPNRFLKHYISSKKPFSKKTLSISEKKISQLVFANNKKKPAVLFTNDSTHLYLYIDKVKANKLDALLGFSNQEGQNKIKFNGYIDISLTNTLHKGETLTFKWNNTGEDQQEIKLNIKNPYIFNTPINTDYKLNIFRRDSSFVNTEHKLTIGYKPYYTQSINTYYQNESSSVINNSNNIAEYQKNIIGFEYIFNKLNDFGLSKTKVKLDLAAGYKKSENKKFSQQKISSDLIHTIEFSSISHLFIENRNAYLKSTEKNINELFRTGGATTIRGFLEQSIISHLHNYTNIEYRHFTNTSSFIYLFSDVGYFKNINNENNLLSFGAGYTLGIPSGLMKISYALGKNQDSGFNINNGLFHINFINIF